RLTQDKLSTKIQVDKINNTAAENFPTESNNLENQQNSIEDRSNTKSLPLNGREEPESGKSADNKLLDKNKNQPQNDSDFVLNNISFVIKKGMTLGLTGLTGSGKTSLVNLVLRLYDATFGEVLIDGTNIKDISLELLRSSIGFVTQEPFLFSKSIRDNIIFGKESLFDNMGDEEIMAGVTDAARLAMLHEEIMGFPYGYETIIGERGVTLSGGQKQRLAIARALMTSPSILILDDSFSSVDTQTEEMILKALKKETGEITRILISHRISTIKDSDMIIVMDNGQISETGTHKDLIKKTGIYKRLYLRQQLSSELEDELEEI
ncbi:MAG: ATP-binding cassette domain-containing protein, partial [Actinomycetota bacterium]